MLLDILIGNAHIFEASHPIYEQMMEKVTGKLWILQKIFYGYNINVKIFVKNKKQTRSLNKENVSYLWGYA